MAPRNNNKHPLTATFSIGEIGSIRTFDDVVEVMERVVQEVAIGRLPVRMGAAIAMMLQTSLSAIEKASNMPGGDETRERFRGLIVETSKARSRKAPKQQEQEVAN